jgi:hypothetical protein
MASHKGVRQVIACIAQVKIEPSLAAVTISQLLYGETFIVHEESKGWCKGTCLHDYYGGFIQAKDLSASCETPSHLIVTTVAPILPAPYMSQPPIGFLSFYSRVRVRCEKDQFYYINGLGWMYQAHLRPLPYREPDYIKTAQRFIGVPFVWGGRSAFGFDCSGLIQLCLMAAGIHAPRDSPEQAQCLGFPIKEAQHPQRGDLFFVKRKEPLLFHAGLFVNNTYVLHAGRDFFAVGVQPFREVSSFYRCLARLYKSEIKILTMRPSLQSSNVS